MIRVDWSQVELRSRGYRGRPTKRESYYACTCERCERTYWLRATDARRAAQRDSACSHCQRQAAGRKGYAATRAKYGTRYALERVAAYQLAHPSKPEQTVRGWLDERCIHFSQQYIFCKDCANFIIDFVIDNQIALEVNGYRHQRHRQARDERLRALWAGPVLFLDAERVIVTPDEAQAELFAVLGNCGRQVTVSASDLSDISF
ncbi:MAG: hypothetical protein ACYDBJ_20810 [Aggregatilineales bacterium]